jgi:hypothetical protein
VRAQRRRGGNVRDEVLDYRIDRGEAEVVHGCRRWDRAVGANGEWLAVGLGLLVTLLYLYSQIGAEWSRNPRKRRVGQAPTAHHDRAEYAVYMPSRPARGHPPPSPQRAGSAGAAAPPASLRAGALGAAAELDGQLLLGEPALLLLLRQGGEGREGQGRGRSDTRCLCVRRRRLWRRFHGLAWGCRLLPRGGCVRLRTSLPVAAAATATPVLLPCCLPADALHRADLAAQHWRQLRWHHQLMQLSCARLQAADKLPCPDGQASDAALHCAGGWCCVTAPCRAADGCASPRCCAAGARQRLAWHLAGLQLPRCPFAALQKQQQHARDCSRSLTAAASTACSCPCPSRSCGGALLAAAPRCAGTQSHGSSRS